MKSLVSWLFCTPKHTLTDPSPKLEVCLRSFPACHTTISLSQAWSRYFQSETLKLRLGTESRAPALTRQASTEDLAGPQAHCAALELQSSESAVLTTETLWPVLPSSTPEGAHRQSWSCLSLCVRITGENLAARSRSLWRRNTASPWGTRPALTTEPWAEVACDVLGQSFKGQGMLFQPLSSLPPMRKQVCGASASLVSEYSWIWPTGCSLSLF